MKTKTGKERRAAASQGKSESSLGDLVFGLLLQILLQSGRNRSLEAHFEGHWGNLVDS
jgi:hypothetical protein